MPKKNKDKYDRTKRANARLAPPSAPQPDRASIYMVQYLLSHGFQVLPGHAYITARGHDSTTIAVYVLASQDGSAKAPEAALESLKHYCEGYKQWSGLYVTPYVAHVQTIGTNPIRLLDLAKI